MLFFLWWLGLLSEAVSYRTMTPTYNSTRRRVPPRRDPDSFRDSFCTYGCIQAPNEVFLA